MRSFIVVFVAFVALLAGVPAHAGEGLDEAGFRDNVLLRIRSMKPEYKYFPAEKINIEKQSSTRVEADGVSLELVAVKITLDPPDGTDEKAGELIMLVDRSGTLMFSDIRAIATGKSLVQDAMDEVSVVELAEDVGETVFTGGGKTEVVLVSDPLCPYCRRAWDMVMSDPAKIGNFKLVHMPLPMHSGADVACMILAYAKTVSYTHLTLPTN